MRAFDLLPRPLRDLLNYAPYKYHAPSVLEALRRGQSVPALLRHAEKKFAHALKLARIERDAMT